MANDKPLRLGVPSALKLSCVAVEGAPAALVVEDEPDAAVVAVLLTDELDPQALIKSAEIKVSPINFFFNFPPCIYVIA
jgi:hypothetical protein